MWRRGDSDDRGAAAVEFALISIPLLLLIVGIVQFGLAYQAQVNVTQAARAAARYGAICGSSGGSCSTSSSAVNAAPGLNLSTSQVFVQYCPAGSTPGGASCSTGDCPSGSTQSSYFEYVEVRYPYAFTFGVLSGGSSPSITIRGKASLPCGG